MEELSPSTPDASTDSTRAARIPEDPTTPAKPPKGPASISTRLQYILTYAVMGAVIPFLSVYLQQRGMSKDQIGYVNAVSSLAVIITPVLVALLADTAIAGRYLMGAIFVLSAGALVTLIGVDGFWPLLIFYTLFVCIYQPTFTLQDGIHFASQAQRKASGFKEESYQSVRVWGTVGYIVPSALLYFFLQPGKGMTPIIWCSIGFCVAGAIYAMTMLPHTPPQKQEAHSRLPTVAAARALSERHVLVFCIAMALLHMGTTGYYIGYPLHLVERTGLDKRWVGLVANIGVVLEIVYITQFDRLVRWLSLRRLMYIGSAVAAMRLFLLAVDSSLWIALGTQLIHGLTVLIIHIAPPVFLNAHAENRYRNSIQGLYLMVFAGSGRVLGSLLSGLLAKQSLALMFAVGGGITLLGTAMFFFAFHEAKRPDSGDEKPAGERG